jgi:hypothetical protein
VFWGRKAFWKEEPMLDEPRRLEGSFIAFYVNGVRQGEAFRDILEGSYFPCLSTFTLPDQQAPVAVRCNFGPELRFQPLLGSMPLTCKPWVYAARRAAIR